MGSQEPGAGQMLTKSWKGNNLLTERFSGIPCCIQANAMGYYMFEEEKVCPLKSSIYTLQVRLIS